jgi:heat shock protein HtpX
MWEIVRANRRRAAVLVGVETLLLAGVGFAFGEALSPGAGLVGLGAGLALALVLFLTGYLAGDRALLALSGARELTPGHHRHQLLNVVEEMKIASGLPVMPRVFIIDDDVPNAFACGRSPRHAAVAVTSGLLKRLNRDELQGVVAHEIGHVVNRDILYMTLVSVMVGAVAILAHVFLRSTLYGGVRMRTQGRRQGGGAQVAFVILAVVLAVLAPIFARLVYLAVSRRREYLADASAAVYTRYPAGLASALEKITSSQGKMARSAPAMAPLYIVPPESRSLAAAGGSGSLWSTHPPTNQRIAILRSIGDGRISYQAYQEAFTRASKQKGLYSEGALAGSRAVEPRAPAPAEKKKKEQKQRLRQVTDLLWQLQGFRFATCACGLKFKVPGSVTRSISCPRCGRPVTESGAGPKDPDSSESAAPAR